MKTTRVTRYISDCGRGFWSKAKCLKHEENCKCWTNPKHRTCKTCKFAKVVNDSNGMEHEPQFLQQWTWIDCQNPDFNVDIHFTEAHEKAPDLCINCPVWQSKSSKQ